MPKDSNCPLCVLSHPIWWEEEHYSVIYAKENQFPILRVIAKKHRAEMTDFPFNERENLMRAVFACEKILKSFFHADKINLASLGNLVPHLHWHVIARFKNDSHYPLSIWGKEQRIWQGAGDDSALQSFFLKHFLEGQK